MFSGALSFFSYHVPFGPVLVDIAVSDVHD